MVWFAVAFGSAITPASADCEQGSLPFSFCEIVDHDASLNACYNGSIVTNRFGKPGEVSELYLSEPIEIVDYQPWDGHALTGSINFNNGDYTYEVVSGFNSEFSDEGLSHFSWINILYLGNPIAKRECVLEKVDAVYGGGLYDRKVAAGLKWYGNKLG